MANYLILFWLFCPIIPMGFNSGMSEPSDSDTFFTKLGLKKGIFQPEIVQFAQ